MFPVNNPTLGEFCFVIIRRADTKYQKAGSLQGIYPGGNYFKTSGRDLGKISMHHVLVVHIRTENQDLANFRPFVLRKFSILAKLNSSKK